MTTLSDLKQKLIKHPEFRHEYEKLDKEPRPTEDKALKTLNTRVKE